MYRLTAASTSQQKLQQNIQMGLFTLLYWLVNHFVHGLFCVSTYTIG